MQLYIREPTSQDKDHFIKAMQESQDFHSPWVSAPYTSDQFDNFLSHSQKTNQKSLLLLDSRDNILGVFNINEIVKGVFQSAYLGFYAVCAHAGKGNMSQGLKLVLAYAFNELNLHRLEANIQPDNLVSINLVKNNGFRKEGFSPRYLFIDGQWRDHERWAITLEDYQ